MILRAIAIAVALLPAAHAEVRQADQSTGKLEFTATQADAKFDGSFKRFHVKLDFDPAHPDHGSLDVTVEAVV